jgi:hypothetical protein
MAPVVELARAELKKSPLSLHPHVLLGRALFRAGQYREAVEELARIDNYFGVASLYLTPSTCRLFRAMALHRSGKEEEARKQLREAAEVGERWGGTSPDWADRLELRLVRREAEGLILGKKDARE